MILFLLSLTVLFLASIVAYLVTRYSHADWQRVRAELPSGLWAAGAFLVGTSVALEVAIRAIRRNDQPGLRQGLWLAGLAGCGFLVAQALNWLSLLKANALDEQRLSLFVFYMLTAIHALHVLGGFVPLAIVLHRAREREYSSSRWEGVKLCTQYWHFLGGVWLVLMVTMFAT